MGEYQILGRKFVTTVGEENRAEIYKMYDALKDSAESNFKKEYKKLKNADEVLQKVDDIALGEIDRVVDISVEYLRKHEIYTINKKIFKEQYVDVSQWVTVSESFREKHLQIVNKQQEMAEYRELRKESRGRFVGGGFGMKGAVKGAMQAGMLNMGTGMLHSMANSVGNAMSSSEAEAEKKKLFNDEENQRFFTFALWDVISSIEHSVKCILHLEIGMEIAVLTNEDCEKANALLDAIDDDMPEEKKKDLLIQALHLNPYDDGIYYWIISEYGDEDGEVERLGILFGADDGIISSKLIKLLSEIECCQQAIENGKYIFDHTPLTRLEHVKESLEDLEKKFQKYGWTKEFAKQKSDTIDKIYKDAEILLHQIEKEPFKNSNEILLVAKDVETLYAFLDGKDIVSNEKYQEVLEEAKMLTFLSKQFPNQLVRFIEKKRKYRNVSELPMNIQYIFQKSNLTTDEQKRIHIWNVTKTFEKKIEAVLKAKIFPEWEKLLVMLDTSILGMGKKGILVSDRNLYFYEIAALSNKVKHCEKIEIGKVKNVSVGDKNTIWVEADTEKMEIRKWNYEDDYFHGKIAIGLNEICYLFNEINRSNSKNVSEELAPKFWEKSIEEKPLLEVDLQENSIEVVKKCTEEAENKEELPQVQKQDVVEKISLKQVFCTMCGNRIEENAKFCTYCGNKNNYQRGK